MVVAPAHEKVEVVFRIPGVVYSVLILHVSLDHGI